MRPGRCPPVRSAGPSCSRCSAFAAIVYLDVLQHIEDEARELGEAARQYIRSTLAAVAPPGLAPVVSTYLDSAGTALSLANRLLLRRSLPTPTDIAFWDRHIVPLAARLDPLGGRFFGMSVLGAWHAPGHTSPARLGPAEQDDNSRRD